MRKQPILIISEDAPHVEILTKFLERKGYKFVVADNPDCGMELYQKKKPLLTLIDLPDGEKHKENKIIEEIKKLNPGALIIIITAHTSKRSAVEALRFGIFDFIKKPIDLEELIWRVERGVDAVKKEEELAKANELVQKLSHVIHQNPACIVFTDVAGNLEYANSSFYKLTGYQERECLGRNLRLLNSGNNRKEIIRNFWNTLHSGKTWRGQWCNKKKNGELYWVQATAFPIISEDGEIKSLVQIAEDMHPILKFENQAKEAKEEIMSKDFALKEVLNHIEKEKDTLKQAVKINSERLLLPLVIKLRKKDTGVNTEAYDLLESNIYDLTSEFGIKVSDKLLNLSPKEIEICNMIRNGCSTKEIASFIGISAQTVDTHRNNIRHKLGISGKNINLTTYLNSL